MKNKTTAAIAVGIAAALTVGAFGAAAADGTEGIAAYYEDFSGNAAGFDFISAPEKMLIEPDPLNPRNGTFAWSGGIDRFADVMLPLETDDTVTLEGKLLREYGANANPYWDLRFQLLTASRAVTLASVGQVIYTGDHWDNVSIWYMREREWVPFRVALKKTGGAIQSELFLNGHSYGKTTVTAPDAVEGFRLYSLNSADNGKIYIDDLALVRETAPLTSLLERIAADSALTGAVSEDECLSWLEYLGGYSELRTMGEYYHTVYSYAFAMGYVSTFSMISAQPEDGGTVYAADTLQYTFNTLLSTDRLPEAVIEHGAESPATDVSVSGNKLTVSADFRPDRQYTLRITSIYNAFGDSYDFAPITFSTSIVPIVNVHAGGRYETGQILEWTEPDGVTTTAVVESGGNSVSVANGGRILMGGSVTLRLTSAKGGVQASREMTFYVTPNTPPTAAAVRISGTPRLNETLTGEYLYSDAEGDAEGGSITEWYLSSTADGAFTKLQDGASLTITADLAAKYLKFAVTPVSVKIPTTGERVFSAAIASPFPPVVSNLEIKGTARVGSVLSAYYDYFDPNGDQETTETLIEWIDSAGGRVATGAAITVDENMKNKKIAVRVTAKNNAEPNTAETVTSAFVTVSGGGSGGGGGGGYGYVSGGAGTDSAPPPLAPLPVPGGDGGDSAAFTDIAGHWAQSDVTRLKELGIVSGVSATHFAPEDAISRSQLLAMLIRLDGGSVSDYGGTFADVSREDWFAGYVQAGLERGILSEDALFRPQDGVTREEAAKLLSIFIGDGGEPPEFSDGGEISAWAIPYVNNAAAIGVMRG
ncbi:MAG: S-layer homology domain-containing protein, partial [Clostridiales bacterium]|nr:S-layer homology domain-containing protein [Clostridiales bacterium]